MTGADLLADAFGRIHETVHRVVAGLTPETLAFRPRPGTNSIAWLLWHLTRVQDDHVADAMGGEQRWLADGWADRFALPFDRAATGYGHTDEEVAAVRVGDGGLLTGYHDAVYERTVEHLRGLTDGDFERIVDESWDPPVTLGVRLVSVIADNLQHAGQAAYLRGLVERL